MFTVKTLPEAKAELKDACKWYNQRQRGLAVRFLDEINYHVELAKQNPYQFPIRFTELYRFITLKVFPFLIVFRINEESKTIYVISFFHTSRNPANL